MTSIRLRLVDWLQGVVDQIGEQVAKTLRCDDTHSYPVSQDDLALVCRVCGRAAERQIDGATLLAILRHNVDKCRNEAGVHDINFATAHSLAAAKNSPNLISHQKFPFSENHPSLVNLNAKLAGVQS